MEAVYVTKCKIWGPTDTAFYIYPTLNSNWKPNMPELPEYNERGSKRDACAYKCLQWKYKQIPSTMHLHVLEYKTKQVNPKSVDGTDGTK